MWKPIQDLRSGVGPNDSKFNDKPIQRRRWDSISNPKLLPSHFEYSPPRSSLWNVSTQIPFERKQCSRTYLEYRGLSSSRLEHWDVSTQVPSKPKLCSSCIEECIPSQPSRIGGGNGCNICPYPSYPERSVESCLPGLHQKYIDVYDSKKFTEGHLPVGYQSFVEHDDLYLPPSRPLSPHLIDHDDLYLPLKTHDEYSNQCPFPCDLRLNDSDPSYRDIYLPPSRPCIPAFPKDPCRYPPLYLPPSKPCPSSSINPCLPPPCNRSPPPFSLQSKSCRPKIECSCSPYIKKLAPCPAPPLNDCSCPPYIKKLLGCSSPPSSSVIFSSPFSSSSRPVQQISSIYIDEVPSPPFGNHYIQCQECLCHKDISTRSLCPSPKNVSPCRDCVCHLGGKSPSQGKIECQPKGTYTQFQTGFQTPGKPPLKLHLNQSQCLECKSPYSCKGPTNCNPQYIVETPLSPNSTKPRSLSPIIKFRSSTHGGNCSTTSLEMRARCQSCDCHKNQINSFGPSKVSPKLFEDPCSCPYRSITPYWPQLAAEMLSGMKAGAIQAKACGKSLSSCIDPRCATCECHKPKYPPSPPPCRLVSLSLSRLPCNSQPSPNSSCKPPSPPCSPYKRAPTSCPSLRDDIHNPIFKTFQSTSPRCKTCDCHKPKDYKLSTQICKFCQGTNFCYCEYHTTQKILKDNSESSKLQHDQMKEGKRAMVSQVSSAKVDFNSPCDEYIGLALKILDKDLPLQSDATQLCCCGKCERTKPQFPIKTNCAFCRNIHSCCCGMCTCPISSCCSKTPLILDGSTPHLSQKNNYRAYMERSNESVKAKSISPRPKKKLGFTSPEKPSPNPLLTSNSHLSSARVYSLSPKTRMKSNVQ